MFWLSEHVDIHLYFYVTMTIVDSDETARLLCGSVDYVITRASINIRLCVKRVKFQF